MKKFLLLFFGIMCLIFSACTTDDYLDYHNDKVVNLVKAPNVIAYSGDMVLGNTFVNKGIVTRVNAGNGDINNQVWKDFNADQLTNITDEERQAVLDAIDEKTTGERISEDVVFPWTAYFLQDVISGQNGNYEGAGSNGTSSSSYTFEAYNKGAECSQKNWPGYVYENYEEVTNSAHLNNYFQKQNADGSQERINETTLMTSMKYGTYEEMKGKQFRWFINCHENLHWYEYIVVEVDGSYYICFDFGCGHSENDVDGNPGRGAEHNDWDYNDWILKITPAGNQPNVWTGDDPEDPTLDPTTPDQPSIPAFKNEVEVNLHGVEKGADGYLESHLSIHVRYATNVEIFIPVPKEYYCDVDDMYIFEDRWEGGYGYGPTPEDKEGKNIYTISYIINDVEISLTIKYEEEGIRITTDGINQDVIDYCRENYGDGITFEVWNYFNDPEKLKEAGIEKGISLSKLHEYLNQATIEFLDYIPEYYVNAFAEEDGNDCTVSVVEEQKNEFNDPETGDWWNGSPYNEIYKNKDFTEGTEE